MGNIFPQCPAEGLGVSSRSASRPPRRNWSRIGWLPSLSFRLRGAHATSADHSGTVRPAWRITGDNMQKTLIVAATIALAAACLPSFARGGGGGHSSGGHLSSGHAASSRAGSSPGVHSVRGYTKKNGTHVAPSHATNPNGTKRDNLSSKGNVNPYTGKAGTKDADK